jgi:pectate lyase
MSYFPITPKPAARRTNVAVAFFVACLACSAIGAQPGLEAVKSFAENVREHGRDRWSGQRTPLLADGINVDTREPVEWVFREADGTTSRWMTHNLGSQQNLFRVLVGLTNLTGDPRYRRIAEDSLRFHFQRLQSECGLLRWGGHQFIDLRTLQPVGRFDADCHELKEQFPFYDLMWQVDPEATARFIRAFWNAHVLDWRKLDMSRHGQYGLKTGDLWQAEFAQPEPFFEGTGLTFWVAGGDLIYAGATLHRLRKERGALTWSLRLADQYVRARHPATGLGASQYSKPLRRQQPPDGPLVGRLTWSDYGDRAENQFGRDFPGVAREGWALWTLPGSIYATGAMYTNFALIQMEVAEALGEPAGSLLTNTVSGLKAYLRHAYDAERNVFRPLWADGTDLTGYVFPRTGYYGPQGTVLHPSPATELHLFSYARAFRLSRDPDLWSAVRSMMKGLDLGDPGEDPRRPRELRAATKNSSPLSIFALLELHRANAQKNYLELAHRVGANLLARSFHRGFFLADARHLNAKFDAIEPLALLSLEAARRGRPDLVPTYSGGGGYIHGQFGDLGRVYDIQAIWAAKRSANPPP